MSLITFNINASEIKNIINTMLHCKKSALVKASIAINDKSTIIAINSIANPRNANRYLSPFIFFITKSPRKFA